MERADQLSREQQLRVWMVWESQRINRCADIIDAIDATYNHSYFDVEIKRMAAKAILRQPVEGVPQNFKGEYDALIEKLHPDKVELASLSDQQKRTCVRAGRALVAAYNMLVKRE